MFLALAKLFLEWLPSAPWCAIALDASRIAVAKLLLFRCQVCILLVFRPMRRSMDADDLIDPLMPSKAYDRKPDLESSEGSEELGK